MLTKIKTPKNLLHVAVLAVFAFVAGCGGGGGDEPSPSNGGDSLGTTLVTCLIVILATNQADCDSSGSSSPPSSPPPSSSPPSSSPPPSSSSSGPLLLPNVEFEPNDDLANANLPQYATRSPSFPDVGWYVAGSINDISDVTDAFAFTPNQTREYFLYLCPPEGSVCDDDSRIDTLTAFFRVLDQDGNVLLTSQADTDNGNKYRMTLAAGVLYYLTVDAGDTMGVTVDYRMFVYERS